MVHQLAKPALMALALLAQAGIAVAVQLPQTAAPMSAADATRAFAGKTLLGPTYDAFIAADGTTKGITGKPKIVDTFTGTWSVTDNEFCIERHGVVQTTPAKDCTKLWRDGYRVFTLWSTRSDGAVVDEVNGYLPYGPKTRAGDIVSQRYQKAGGL